MSLVLFLVVCTLPIGGTPSAGVGRAAPYKRGRLGLGGLDRPVCDTQTGEGCALWEHTPLKFEGGLFGVKAKVLLYPEQERALVQLKGIPIGGPIAGVAWFKPDGMAVELDPEFERLLRRRLVRIESAGAEEGYGAVWVRVRLPRVLGTHTMSLARVDK